MTTVYLSGCNVNGFRLALKCTVSLKRSVKNENMTLVFNYRCMYHGIPQKITCSISFV